MGLPGLLRAVIASVCLGSIMAQKVTQNRSEISVLEKEDVTLNCAYEANSYTYYLFWYKQPPSGEMIFLIHQESYNELNTTKGLSGEDRVEQSPQTLRIQEGDSLSLNCSYTVSRFNGLQWCERDGCGAESPSPESPGGIQLYSAV
ncbi:hypothetical protein MJG53_007919 [Ovis ammon polii x Ovis aries]|uniref:Uncharacterized protein n=1 Tax=Ovis ammon polii x Ovis aries TaxID=2918886 RepID=A0ACB9UYK1_9CETA|nr:hypothetical protein MJG53_007919 [Ovis ammon polii x Ovis aries]